MSSYLYKTDTIIKTKKTKNTFNNKYKAKKTTIDGITFDSKKESERYKVLKNLENLGNISNLELQPKFLLQEGYRHNSEKNKIRSITYTADFRYINSDGLLIVEDVKGLQTEVFKIKKKLLLYKYPEINFILT